MKEKKPQIECRGRAGCLCGHRVGDTCLSLQLPLIFLSLYRMTRRKSVQCGSSAPVPCVCENLLIPQGEHLLHGGDPGAGKALAVLAHFDGIQPLRHRPKHGAVTAAGAGQANGHPAGDSVDLITHHFFPRDGQWGGKSHTWRSVGND